MAKLVNISSEVFYVGGWQRDQQPAGQMIRIKLMPGESVDIPSEVIHHPEVRRLAESGNFELQDVALVAGGPVEARPVLRKGDMRLIRKVVPFSAFANDAVPSKAVALDFIPSGSMITDVRVRLSASFNDAMALELGSASDPNSVLVSEDLTVAPDCIVRVPSLSQLDYVASGFQLLATFTVGSTLNSQAAGSVEILVSYFVC